MDDREYEKNRPPHPFEKQIKEWESRAAEKEKIADTALHRATRSRLKAEAETYRFCANQLKFATPE